MILSDATKIYYGASETVKVYLGATEVWSPAGGAAPEWLAWDFDPFNPLLGEDFLVTQIFM